MRRRVWRARVLAERCSCCAWDMMARWYVSKAHLVNIVLRHTGGVASAFAGIGCGATGREGVVSAQNQPMIST